MSLAIFSPLDFRIAEKLRRGELAPVDVDLLKLDESWPAGWKSHSEIAAVEEYVVQEFSRAALSRFRCQASSLARSASVRTCFLRLIVSVTENAMASVSDLNCADPSPVTSSNPCNDAARIIRGRTDSETVIDGEATSHLMSPAPSAATMPISEMASPSRLRDCAIDDRVPARRSLIVVFRCRISRLLGTLARARIPTEVGVCDCDLSVVPALASGNVICFTLCSCGLFRHQPSGGLGMPCFLQFCEARHRRSRTLSPSASSAWTKQARKIVHG